MPQFRTEPETPFIPIKVPRRIYLSFDPAVRAFIDRRVQHGEAIIQEEGESHVRE